MRTTRNENVVAQAANAAGRANHARTVYFVRNLKAGDFVAVNSAELDLYGTRTYVVDQTRFARAFSAACLPGADFETALALAEKRIELFNAPDA